MTFSDIQSWWEVPSIAHFCSLFRVAFNLLDFDIEVSNAYISSFPSFWQLNEIDFSFFFLL